MIPVPPSSKPKNLMSTAQTSATVSSADNKKATQPSGSNSKSKNFKKDPVGGVGGGDSSIPVWAQRGISWRSVREIFDDTFVPADEKKSEDILELEAANLAQTMKKYSLLYDEVGLSFLNNTCAVVPPEDEHIVQQQIQQQHEQDLMKARQSAKQKEKEKEKDKKKESSLSMSQKKLLAADEQQGEENEEDEDEEGNLESIAFCFNCRETGHTHGVCPKERRCYICHDARHDAFVCVANPVYGSEFFEFHAKCGICGERGHISGHCKSRGGPWRGKPGYAHLPDTTYPRPLIINVGRTGKITQQASDEAKKIIVTVVEANCPDLDAGLMQLMRDAELFCATLPLLADDRVTGYQRVQVRNALQTLRSAIAGVDLASFYTAGRSKRADVGGRSHASSGSGSGNVLDDEAALNELRTSSIDFNVVVGNKIVKFGRSEGSAEFRIKLQRIQAKTGLSPRDINLYDDDEVAKKIHDQIQEAKEIAAKAAVAGTHHHHHSHSHSHSRRSGSSGGGGRSGSRSSSHQSRSSHSHQHASTTSGTFSAATSGSTLAAAAETGSTTSSGGARRSTGSGSPVTSNTGNSPPRNKNIPRPPSATNNSSSSNTFMTQQPTTSSSSSSQKQQQQQQHTTSSKNRPPSATTSQKSEKVTTTTATTSPANRPMPTTTTTTTTSPSSGKLGHVFKGSLLRPSRNLDPVAAEQHARSRRETAGEVTLMRWTRMLSKGISVAKVTSEEAASSFSSDVTRQELKKQSNQDLLRLMKAAVNSGDSDVIEGKTLQIPRVQHGQIGRDSVIHAWSESPAETAAKEAEAAKEAAIQRQKEEEAEHEAQQQLQQQQLQSPATAAASSHAASATTTTTTITWDDGLPKAVETITPARHDISGAGFLETWLADQHHVVDMKQRRYEERLKKMEEDDEFAGNPRAAAAFKKKLLAETRIGRPTTAGRFGVAAAATASGRGGSGSSSISSSKKPKSLLHFANSGPNEQDSKNGGENKNAVEVGSNSPTSSPNKRKLMHDKEEPIKNWNAHKVAMEWGREDDQHHQKQKQKQLQHTSLSSASLNNNNKDNKTVTITGDVIPLYLHAKERFDSVTEAAEQERDDKIATGRREEIFHAKREYDSTISKLGDAPLLNKVVDPDIVSKWKGRFQTARIRAGVRDAAMKEWRLVHRAVVATGSLGGTAICDGAQKRAERWLRSHRDVETDAISSMMSGNTSMWTNLCHRIAVAAVRVRGKRELAEELHGFLQRLPLGRATQDESMRMVDLFERIAYGSEEQQQEKQGSKKKGDSALSAGSVSVLDDRMSATEGLIKKKFPIFRSLTDERVVQRLVTSVEWQTTYPGEYLVKLGDEADSMYFIYTGLVEVLINIKGQETPVATLKAGDLFGEMALLSTEKRQLRTASVKAVKHCVLLRLSKEAFDEITAVSSELKKCLGGIAEARKRKLKERRAGDNETLELCFKEWFGEEVPGSDITDSQSPSRLAEANAQRAPTKSKVGDLDRLLSAPVTAMDVENVIERACRESYQYLFDNEDRRRALPSTIKIWSKGDPRRHKPRTQEGECVASFLRWLVSPECTAGQLGRSVSYQTCSEPEFPGATATTAVSDEE